MQHVPKRKRFGEKDAVKIPNVIKTIFESKNTTYEQKTSDKITKRIRLGPQHNYFLRKRKLLNYADKSTDCSEEEDEGNDSREVTATWQEHAKRFSNNVPMEESKKTNAVRDLTGIVTNLTEVTIQGAQKVFAKESASRTSGDLTVEHKNSLPIKISLRRKNTSFNYDDIEKQLTEMFSSDTDEAQQDYAASIMQRPESETHNLSDVISENNGIEEKSGPYKYYLSKVTQTDPGDEYKTLQVIQINLGRDLDDGCSQADNMDCRLSGGPRNVGRLDLKVKPSMSRGVPHQKRALGGRMKRIPEKLKSYLTDVPKKTSMCKPSRDTKVESHSNDPTMKHYKKKVIQDFEKQENSNKATCRTVETLNNCENDSVHGDDNSQSEVSRKIDEQSSSAGKRSNELEDNGSNTVGVDKKKEVITKIARRKSVSRSQFRHDDIPKYKLGSSIHELKKTGVIIAGNKPEKNAPQGSLTADIIQAIDGKKSPSGRHNLPAIVPMEDTKKNKKQAEKISSERKEKFPETKQHSKESAEEKNEPHKNKSNKHGSHHKDAAEKRPSPRNRSPIKPLRIRVSRLKETECIPTGTTESDPPNLEGSNLSKTNPLDLALNKTYEYVLSDVSEASNEEGISSRPEGSKLEDPGVDQLSKKELITGKTSDVKTSSSNLSDAASFNSIKAMKNHFFITNIVNKITGIKGQIIDVEFIESLIFLAKSTMETDGTLEVFDPLRYCYQMLSKFLDKNVCPKFNDTMLGTMGSIIVYLEKQLFAVSGNPETRRYVKKIVESEQGQFLKSYLPLLKQKWTDTSWMEVFIKILESKPESISEDLKSINDYVPELGAVSYVKGRSPHISISTAIKDYQNVNESAKALEKLQQYQRNTPNSIDSELEDHMDVHASINLTLQSMNNTEVETKKRAIIQRSVSIDTCREHESKPGNFVPPSLVPTERAGRQKLMRRRNSANVPSERHSSVNEFELLRHLRTQPSNSDPVMPNRHDMSYLKTQENSQYGKPYTHSNTTDIIGRPQDDDNLRQHGISAVNYMSYRNQHVKPNNNNSSTRYSTVDLRLYKKTTSMDPRCPNFVTKAPPSTCRDPRLLPCTIDYRQQKPETSPKANLNVNQPVVNPNLRPVDTNYVPPIDLRAVNLDRNQKLSQLGNPRAQSNQFAKQASAANGTFDSRFPAHNFLQDASNLSIRASNLQITPTATRDGNIATGQPVPATRNNNNMVNWRSEYQDHAHKGSNNSGSVQFNDTRSTNSKTPSPAAAISSKNTGSNIWNPLLSTRHPVRNRLSPHENVNISIMNTNSAVTPPQLNDRMCEQSQISSQERLYWDKHNNQQTKAQASGHVEIDERRQSTVTQKDISIRNTYHRNDVVQNNLPSSTKCVDGLVRVGNETIISDGLRIKQNGREFSENIPMNTQKNPNINPLKISALVSPKENTAGINNSETNTYVNEQQILEKSTYFAQTPVIQKNSVESLDSGEGNSTLQTTMEAGTSSQTSRAVEGAVEILNLAENVEVHQNDDLDSQETTAILPTKTRDDVEQNTNVINPQISVENSVESDDVLQTANAADENQLIVEKVLVQGGTSMEITKESDVVTERNPDGVEDNDFVVLEKIQENFDDRKQDKKKVLEECGTPLRLDRMLAMVGYLKEKLPDVYKDVRRKIISSQFDENDLKATEVITIDDDDEEEAITEESSRSSLTIEKVPETTTEISSKKIRLHDDSSSDSMIITTQQTTSESPTLKIQQVNAADPDNSMEIKKIRINSNLDSSPVIEIDEDDDTSKTVQEKITSAERSPLATLPPQLSAVPSFDIPRKSSQSNNLEAAGSWFEHKSSIHTESENHKIIRSSLDSFAGLRAPIESRKRKINPEFVPIKASVPIHQIARVKQSLSPVGEDLKLQKPKLIPALQQDFKFTKQGLFLPIVQASNHKEPNVNIQTFPSPLDSKKYVANLKVRRSSVESRTSMSDASSPSPSEELASVSVGQSTFQMKKHFLSYVPEGKLYYKKETNSFVQCYANGETKDLRHANQPQLPPKWIFSSEAEFTDAAQFSEEFEKVQKFVPTAFAQYYRFVTGYQIFNLKKPVSFQTFLEMHNGDSMETFFTKYLTHLQRNSLSGVSSPKDWNSA